MAHPLRASALAEQILGWPGLAAQLGDAQLHMLGVDFGPDGLTGAKLYVQHPRMAVDLGEGAPRSLCNVLTIHRCSPGSMAAASELPAASEIDFGLIDNQLLWPALATTPRVAALLRKSWLEKAIFEAFRLAVRRVSLASDAAPKISVYYALREVEEP